ncbi:hypothetical protein [Peijinzhouia sedimentorum]
MEKSYINKNLVFIGEFKPSNFDKFTFIKEGFLVEEDFLDGSIFLPDLTIIDTKNLVIEINQNRLSINFKIVDFEINIGKLISLLSTSKIKAFGFNFKRALFINDSNESKKYFYFENNVLNKFFNSNDTAYGYYVSRNIMDARLKLDIKPVQLQKINEDVYFNALDFSFNFHFEDDNFVEKLESYRLYEQMTLDIINNYE